MAHTLPLPQPMPPVPASAPQSSPSTTLAAARRPPPPAAPNRLPPASPRLLPSPADLEWKLTYVGSAESEKYDQVLDTVFVGPVAPGQYRFVFQVRPRVLHFTHFEREGLQRPPGPLVGCPRLPCVVKPWLIGRQPVPSFPISKLPALLGVAAFL